MAILGGVAVSYERGTPVTPVPVDAVGRCSGASLTRNTPLPGPYNRTAPKSHTVVLGVGGLFFMREVPLYLMGPEGGNVP
jgi:hypothetical protein